MIPEFDERGCLPPGIYKASLDEIEARFGRDTDERREQMQSIHWLMEMVRRDDVLRVILNGSFVTGKADPGDVDCVILGGPTFGDHGIMFQEWQAPLPYIHLEIVDVLRFDDYIKHVFGKDGDNLPKGMIEVLI